ncbi:MAG: hypothetical protein RI988_3639, partial [Pseudomonadota bacterium]
MSPPSSFSSRSSRSSPSSDPVRSLLGTPGWQAGTPDRPGPPAPPWPLAPLLARADVRTDGARPWDLQVHRARLYRRVLTRWSLGLGDAYVDGDWDCERLDELFTRLMSADLDRDGGGLLARGFSALAW